MDNQRLIAQLRLGPRRVMFEYVQGLYNTLSVGAMLATHQSFETSFRRAIDKSDRNDSVLLVFLRECREKVCAELGRVFRGFQLRIDWNDPAWILNWEPMVSRLNPGEEVLVDFPSDRTEPSKEPEQVLIGTPPSESEQPPRTYPIFPRHGNGWSLC